MAGLLAFLLVPLAVIGIGVVIWLMLGSFLEALFVMLVIQAPAGDRRNWEAIRSWAAGLPAVLGSGMPKAEE